jgi:hypothetical protein
MKICLQTEMNVCLQTSEIDFYACQCLPIALPLLDIHATGLPSETTRL